MGCRSMMYLNFRTNKCYFGPELKEHLFSRDRNGTSTCLEKSNENFDCLTWIIIHIDDFIYSYCSMDVASAPLSTTVPSVGQRISPYLSRSLVSKEEKSNFVCQKGAIHASLNSDIRFVSETSAEDVRKKT